MISITPYKFDYRLSGAFVDFLYNHYLDDARWLPSDRGEIKNQFDEQFPFYRRIGNFHQHFIAMGDGGAVGHVSAIVNRDLKDKDGMPIGAVGLFECINDRAVADRLLTAATDWLKSTGQVRLIWGPVDFDIWRRYRFMTRGFAGGVFRSEPYNKPYYPELFEACGFAVTRRWRSVEVAGLAALEDVIAPFGTDYKRSLEDRIRFRPVDFRNPAELEILHSAMTHTIEEFPGYTPLAFDDFLAMIMTDEEMLDARLITFGQNKDASVVAFSICFPESETKAIFYLIGVVPEMRRVGLGAATFYNAVRTMMNAGYDTVTMALLAEDSPARLFLGEYWERPTKEYALYEIAL